ncbi:MAG: SEL1-like repeat protein, partial [Proteobacteria bacterium]|nr:SEL1-like repeat protein [Pseudomonadota bacterium]
MSKKHKNRKNKSSKQVNSQIIANYNENYDQYERPASEPEEQHSASQKSNGERPLSELELQHPALLKSYSDLVPIGQGAQATMIKAKDKDGQSVAIKVFDLKSTDEWKNVELFEREIDVLKNIHVQGVPAYIDTIHSDEYIYLVEEYIDAQSLEKQINSGRIYSVEECITILEGVAKILDDLAKCNPPVVHRDIKPANLLVDESLNVFLVDFGVVADNTKTFSMTFAGTAGYVAPEQLYGKATAVSDIFSLGMTCLHIFTGVAPADMQLDGIVPDVKRYMPKSAPKWIPDLIKRMVSVNPAERPQSANELLQCIDDGKQGRTPDESLPVKTEDGDEIPAMFRKEYKEITRKMKRAKVVYTPITVLLALFSVFCIVTGNSNLFIFSLIMTISAAAKGGKNFFDLYHQKKDLLGDIKEYGQSEGSDKQDKQESESNQSAKPLPSLSELSPDVVRLLERANNGDAEAQCDLGYAYDCGNGVKQDKAMAVEWYQRSARQGYKIGQFNLGIAYRDGFVTKDDKLAFMWFKKAANQGYEKAQTEVGRLYHYGIGVDRDDKEAIKWFRKAAEKNYSRAMNWMGVMYVNGFG